MVDISDAELTLIENTLVTMREVLGEDESPQAQQIKEQIVEAEQIVSGKLDKSDQGTPIGSDTTNKTSNQMLAGAAALEGEGLPIEDAKKMMSYMQEMMTIMQKAMGPMGGQEEMMTMEACMASGKSHEECLAMMAAPSTA